MDRYRIDCYQAATQFLYSTVRVETHYPDQTVGAGTAFFFEDASDPEERKSYLVTNRHVLQGADSAKILLHASPTQERSNFTVSEERWLSLPNPMAAWTCHPDDAVDLCAISVNALKKLAESQLDSLFFMPMGSWGIPPSDEESRYPAILSVAMIGYPTGLWDETNNLPILRRGTTASHPAIDFDGRPEVVVDIACFPGSSGSPLALFDREYFASAHRFLGVLYAGPVFTNYGEIEIRHIPTRTVVLAEIPTMIHLGYVIKARKVLELARHCASVEKGP